MRMKLAGSRSSIFFIDSRVMMGLGSLRRCTFRYSLIASM